MKIQWIPLPSVPEEKSLKWFQERFGEEIGTTLYAQHFTKEIDLEEEPIPEPKKPKKTSKVGG